MSESLTFLPTTAELKALPEASDALPLETRLGEFEIREVIGVGGFGIVYRAWDLALEREVALKEYMPMGMVGRGADGRLTLRSRSYEENFTLGLRSFVNEARLLARFDHPALVKVYRFWEGNGTAYMVMPFYQARTLRQRRHDMGTQAPTPEWLLSMVDPLLGALEEMHRADVYHRDIAPDNILWCADSRPVLLDFGAARHVLTDRTQTLTAILKPQFAPIEQYADARSMRQGPWTDIFALASTCYFMLTGRPPLPATARVLTDELTPLAQLAPAGYAPHVLATLDWAMAVRPQDRPQSVAILRDALHGLLEVPERASPVIAAPDAGAVTATNFEKTVQSLPQAGAESQAAGGSDGLKIGWAFDDLATPSTRSDGARAPGDAKRIRPIRSLVLLLAVVTVGASAWLAPWHATPPAPEASAHQPLVEASAASSSDSASTLPAPSTAAASAPVSIDPATTPRLATAEAPRPSAPARRQRTSGTASARDGDGPSTAAAHERRATSDAERAAREDIAWASAHEASAPARSTHPRKASAHP